MRYLMRETRRAIRKIGRYEHSYFTLKIKMAAAKLGFEIYALTTIPERVDVGDASGGERGASETPPKPVRRREGHRAAFNGLEGYYRERVKGKSEGASETPDFPVTVSKLMTCERKYAFEPCCMLFASLIRGLLCIIRSHRHFVFYHEY